MNPLWIPATLISIIVVYQAAHIAVRKFEAWLHRERKTQDWEIS